MDTNIKCPYCAEEIKSEAKICKHCGKEITFLDKMNIKAKQKEEQIKKEKEEKERLEKEKREKEERKLEEKRNKLIEKLQDKINLYPEKYKNNITEDIDFLEKLKNMNEEDIKKDIFNRDRRKKIWILWIITFFIPYILPISIWLHPAKDEKDLFINRFKNFKKHKLRIFLTILSFLFLYLFFNVEAEQENIEQSKTQQNLKIQQTNEKIDKKDNKTEDIIKEAKKEELKDTKMIELEKEKKKELEENERVKKAIEKLEKEITGIDNLKIDKSGIEMLKFDIAIFGAYALIVEEYINDKNEKVRNLANQLKVKVSKVQSKEFPQMRKAYADLINKKMWEYNIEVYTKGNYHGTIEFVGGLFASNKNKLDIYTSLKDMLELLRFDRVNFKWYKYDDNYTYWKIDSLLDKEVDTMK